MLLVERPQRTGFLALSLHSGCRAPPLEHPGYAPFALFRPLTHRTELSHLEQGNPVAQAYALYYLTQAVAAAAPYAPTTVTARPRPTAEAVSLTLQFACGYRLQVTTPYPQADQRDAPRIILSLFHYERLQYAQAVPRERMANYIAGALYPIS